MENKLVKYDDESTNSLEVKDFFIKNHRRIVKSILPILIVLRIEEIGISNPSNIQKLIRIKYHVRISSGTIYPIFYHLESNEIIEKLHRDWAKKYILTSKGKIIVDVINSDKINYDFKKSFYLNGDFLDIMKNY